MCDLKGEFRNVLAEFLGKRLQARKKMWNTFFIRTKQIFNVKNLSDLLWLHTVQVSPVVTTLKQLVLEIETGDNLWIKASKTDRLLQIRLAVILLAFYLWRDDPTKNNIGLEKLSVELVELVSTEAPSEKSPRIWLLLHTSCSKRALRSVILKIALFVFLSMRKIPKGA